MTNTTGTPTSRRLSRTRVARFLPIAAALVPLASVVILAFVDVSTAAASPSVTCSISSSSVVVTVAGGSASDALLVTTSSGDYVVEFDGTQTCTSQTLSDSVNPTLKVAQTPSASTPTTFQPGSDEGIEFEGAAGAPTTFDLSSAPTATTINASSGQVTLGAVTDTFTGISTFIGSASGSTQFIAGSGGLSFTGQGSGNSLSLAPAPASSTINADAGTATIGTGTVTFSGVQTFIGSSSGSNTFVAGTSNESFADNGSAGGDKIDFSNVATSPTTPLTLNLTGTNVGGQTTSTGVVGATTYSFSVGASNFSKFTGSTSGNVRFLAGASASTFTGQGSGNKLDFSSVSASTTINASTGQATVGTVTETFSGITTFVGSGSGGTEFIAGSGGVSFTGQGAGNTLSLAPAPADSTINPGSGTATIGTGTVTFTGVRTFIGSSAGFTTFKPDASTSYSLTGQGSGNALDLSSAPAPTTINASSGQATFSTVTDTFTGISTFIGSASGSTQFIAGSGGLSFTGQGSGNSLSLAPAPASSTINADAGTATIGTGTVTFSGVQTFIGSSSGSNTFVAGTSNESFADNGSAGGDKIDFSNVATSPTTPLTLNLTGTNVGGQTTSTGVVGATTYSFSVGASNFSKFTGSTSGNVRFLAGASASTFTGQGSGNKLDFSSVSASTTINASTGQATVGTVTETFSGITTFVGSGSGGTEFIAGSGGVSFTGQGAGNTLSLAPAPADSTINPGSGTATIGTGTVTFTGVRTFIGSSAGFTTFKPDASTSYSLTGQGSGNALDLSSAPAPTTINASSGQATFSTVTDTFTGISTFIGSASGSTQFIAGSGGDESFVDSGTVGGDTVDLSQVVTGPSAPLTLNLTGGTVNGQSASTALVGSTTYTFAGGAFSTFIGSSTGNDDVLAGQANGFQFTGQGSANILDLSHTSTLVTLDLGQSAPQATGGAGSITLAPGSIQTVIGSNFGNHLVAGPGTVTLQGGKGVDWLQAGSGTDTIDAGSGASTLVGGSGVDTMTGGTGSDTFIPGTGGGKLTDTTGVGTLDFSQATAAVHVNLGTNSYTARNHVHLPAKLASGGGGMPITLVGLRNVIGSRYRNDVIRLGTRSGTIMAGNGSGDQLVGSTAGGSTLHGGSGGDTFTSVGPNDHMSGGVGNDTFYADNGHKDYIDGGGGHNVAHVDCTDVRDRTFKKIQRIYEPNHC